MNHLEITHNIGRVFIVGDLHGCYDKFYQKLNEVDFDFDHDLVIATGDLVDRGIKSLDCFNLIYKSWFKTVRGNHEQFCHDYIYLSDDIKENHKANGGKWFYTLSRIVQEKIAKDIDDLPIIITLNKNNKRYGIVHANIPTYINSWNELIEFLNTGNDDTIIQSCLWGRTRCKQAMARRWESLPCDYFHDVDEIYLGHTVIHNPKKVGNLNFIDTGAVFEDAGFGNLTMIELK